MISLRSLPAVTAGLILSGAATPAIAAQCTRGWAGTINYTRAQSNSDNKTVQRVTGKGTETTNWVMNANYAAQIAVRALPEAGLSTGRANINLASVSTETKSAHDQDVCPHTKERRQVSGQFVSKSETRAQGSGLETDVSIGVDEDGHYTVSLVLPEIEGTVSGSSSASYSGQCTPKKGTNQTLGETPTKIDGIRFGSDGDDRVDRSDPNRLTGSHSVSAHGVTETLSWNLRRCGPSLRLADLKFEDMRFPRWNDWQEIPEQRATIDGNIVRVTAIVANDGDEEKAATVRFKETYKGDRWDGAKPDSGMEELSVTVPAGEQREVQFTWDSSGYAWFDDGRPRLIQRIRAELEDRGKKVDEQTDNLKVAPRPLVLVHGAWEDWRIWESWQNILTTTHSYDWKAYPVGEKSEYGRMDIDEEFGSTGRTDTIFDHAQDVEKYIEYAQAERNAWHVDLVAHSLGGLISRQYINTWMPSYSDGKPQVTRLLMLGTPNMGTGCADLMSFALEAVGQTLEAVEEMRPSRVAKFNARVTQRKGTQFSALAGTSSRSVCSMMDPSDGVVSVPSATWQIEDAMQMDVSHADMMDTAPFSSFVRPRLAIGPAKAKAAGAQTGMSGGGGGAPRILLIDDAPEAPEPGRPDFAKVVKLAPGATIDMPLPVRDARNLGLTFVAAGTVSATLIDDKGRVAGANLAATPQAGQPFRSLFVDRPVATGEWTIRLHNAGDAAREVILASWSSPN
ncbi:triacylglycerol lipase [Sphingosinicella sp. BN140058]|uniref:esterase/lipase family protein n=1 Tax=Sphingosinicella sp. BN140058 TaxID=1892855 RepID=UPI001010F69C|nr:alpha/beta fold hydrolase [Sphingosinicella sp. BN140058]QAY75837.1 hypothetical protein ETR14_04290 [Sphingosinicella sp. BN140058]